MTSPHAFATAPTDDAALGRVSVVVCTRDRPASLERTIRSLLASRRVDLDLIVVDQSDGTETETMLRPMAHRGDLRYLRSDRRGLGAALAEGTSAAQSQYVVHTDDDCEAPPEWAAGMADALRRSPDVALVFSNVIAGPFDPSAGCIPDYEGQKTRVLSSVLAMCRGRGNGVPSWPIGASMAYRRDAIEAIGNFDRALGAGSRFRSAEDWDMQLRVLLRGWKVLQTPDVFVVHHGFRTWAEGREHTGRDWFGNGAVVGKLLRVGRPSFILVAAWVLAREILSQPVLDLLHGRRPRGLLRITSFIRGVVTAFGARIDRETMCFVDMP
jgi:GT2 family glycosyltransferase